MKKKKEKTTVVQTQYKTTVLSLALSLVIVQLNKVPKFQQACLRNFSVINFNKSDYTINLVACSDEAGWHVSICYLFLLYIRYLDMSQTVNLIYLLLINHVDYFDICKILQFV